MNRKEDNTSSKSFYDALKEYFENTPRDKVLEDWAKSAEYDKIGPTVEEFLDNTNKQTNRMSTEKKTIEVDVDILKKCYNVFSGFSNPLNDKSIDDYEECLQILKYLVEQEPKHQIEPPTERTYPIDFIVKFCKGYTNLYDEDDSKIIKDIIKFEREYDKQQYLDKCAEEYDLKHNNQ
jgi:hypothetical protein